jgi:dsDNA-specific endonuclease/ATPase MutS2
MEFEDAFPIPITSEFELHAFAPRDVKAAVEAYLEGASAIGLKALRIVHGKGIGVQREIVRSVLSRSPLVAGFRNAPEEAGGWGATLVDLK